MVHSMLRPLADQLPPEVYGGLAILADDSGVSVREYVETLLGRPAGETLAEADRQALDSHVAGAVQNRVSPRLRRADMMQRWRQDASR